MYLGLFRTRTNQFVKETDTWEEAWKFLHLMAESHTDVIRAVVLKEETYLDDQCPDFDSCPVVASMRILK